MSQSKILEYTNVYLEYEYYNDTGCRSSSLAVLRENFDENMKEFDAVVNERLEEGWQLLGQPTFSSDWLCRSGGIAVQALVREKNIEPAIVVEVHPTVVIAECVRQLRSSNRVTRSNS